MEGYCKRCGNSFCDEANNKKRWSIIIYPLLIFYVLASAGYIYGLHQTVKQYYNHLIMIEQEYANLKKGLNLE